MQVSVRRSTPHSTSNRPPAEPNPQRSGTKGRGKMSPPTNGELALREAMIRQAMPPAAMIRQAISAAMIRQALRVRDPAQDWQKQVRRAVQPSR
ncbi:hypothetical protein SAMD00023353_7700330 [Rosellinia necatrix]|uniref:Uncharacterized protein n=1 Tax=Rosellinia necatrix TaxID=77044 RepID=A0A1W2TU81_ROSNE|nr:hypothetical protein SAMD00023353_7700330 [Rosellinia necatrix]